MHVGQHFEIREEGDWWAAVPDEEWPDAASGQRGIILADFQPSVGDRRQEIVFIGAGMDEVSLHVVRKHGTCYTNMLIKFVIRSLLHYSPMLLVNVFLHVFPKEV